MTRAAIGFGANLGDAARTVQAAIAVLGACRDVTLVAASRLYRTAPWGGIAQPEYVNAAALIETPLSPQALLETLLEVEQRFGRCREDTQRWGPRSLDLDLLLFGEWVVDELGLRVPHPHLQERAFVLVPLAEIAPHMPIPGGATVQSALAQVDARGVILLQDSL